MFFQTLDAIASRLCHRRLRHRRLRHRRSHQHTFTPRCERLENRLVYSSLFTAADVIVTTGDPVPDADGSFNGVFETVTDAPLINDNSQALFHASFENTSNFGSQGLFRVSALSITQIVRDDQAVSQIVGSLQGVGDQNFSLLPFSESGQALFNVGDISGVSNDQDTGYFIGSGTPASLTEIVREGGAAPAATGMNGQFGHIRTGDPALNDFGQIAFTQGLVNTNDGLNDDTGVFRGDTAGNLVQIAREGQAVPNSAETFAGFSDPTINDNGHVAFVGYGSHLADGIYRGDGAAPLAVIAQEGGLINSAGETFGVATGSSSLARLSAFGVAVNNGGQVAFRGDIEAPGGNPVGVFVGDGTDLIEIVREGDAIDVDHTYRNRGLRRVALNENGAVAFLGESRRTSDGFQFDTIFRGDGNSPLVAIAREGQRVPADDAKFFGFRQFALNDAGQVAFVADLQFDSGGSRRDGLFFYDDTLGFVEIAREGGQLNGAEIVRLQFAGNSSGAHDYLPSNRDGLNNSGQIAFSFTLHDPQNSQGVAIVNTDGSGSVELDFGDAPDSYGVHLTSGGARHIATGPILGSQRDTEADGQPPAGGEDSGPSSDEDGIVQTGSVVATDSSSTTASFSAVASEAGLLDAWFDFNRDGEFDVASEQIFDSVSVAAGTNVLPFEVPAGAQPGSTYGRFRLSSAGGLAPIGRAADGEVEDYGLVIEDGTTAGANVIVRQPTPGAIDVVAGFNAAEVIVRTRTVPAKPLFRARASAINQIDIFGTNGDDELNLADLSGVFGGPINVNGGDGHDMLRLTGDSQSLHVTTANFQGVEVIDITGSGDNALTLDAGVVAQNSAGNKTLLVRADAGDSVAPGAGWVFSGTVVENGSLVRSFTQNQATLRLVGPRDWTNPINALDVNADGLITPNDVLLVVNEINNPKFSAGYLTDASRVSQFPDKFFDTVSDGLVAPSDVLAIINHINRTDSTFFAEGEAVLNHADLAPANTAIDTRMQLSNPSNADNSTADLPTWFTARQFPKATSQGDAGSPVRCITKCASPEQDLVAAIDAFFEDFECISEWEPCRE